MDTFYPATIRVRVSAKMMADIEALARRRQVRVSEYVRAMLAAQLQRAPAGIELGRREMERAETERSSDPDAGTGAEQEADLG